MISRSAAIIAFVIALISVLTAALEYACRKLPPNPQALKALGI